MKYILSLCFLIISLYNSYSQGCNNTPVKEAVRNGDFEAGYLTGTNGAKHTFTAGGDFDFYSDFAFGGQNFSGTGPGTCGCCQYGMGDKYMVARAEAFTCAGTNYVDNTYWGISYGGDKNFKDHTPGKNGKGYALLVDLNGLSVSPKTGGLPIAWEQTMDIFPSQKYWFSAFVANFSNGTAPIMQVTIIPGNNGVQDNSKKVTLPAVGNTTGLMNWTQMSAEWMPVGIYNQATIRFEFVNVSGGSGGLDVAIDDISFINSCQNLTSAQQVTLPKDTINLCATNNGSEAITATYATANGNETYYWFSGEGNSQTLIKSGAGAANLQNTINAIGNYRICVEDPNNSCAVNANVIAIKEMEINLNNIDLCSPSQVSLNANNLLNPSGSYPKNYSWNVPAGVTNPGNNSNITILNSGNYSLTVTNPNVTGCSASDNFVVTSKLPLRPDTVEYCDGGGATVALVGKDGKKYSWSTQQSMSPLIGSGTSVNWNIPNGTTGNQTLWFQSAETSPLGTGGPNIATTSSALSTLNTVITASEPVLLKTASIGVEAWTGGCSGAGSGNAPVTVSVIGPGNSTVSSKIVQVNCGSTSPVNLDLNIPAGQYTLRVSSSAAGNILTVANWSGTPSTYSIGGGVVQITGYETTTNYGGLGTLVFERSQACDPIPVPVKAIVCCTAPTANPTINVNASVLQPCAPGTASLVSGTLPNGLAFRWQTATSNTGPWTEVGGTGNATGTVNGGSVTRSNITTSGWYRLVIAEAGNIDKPCVKESTPVEVRIKPRPVITANEITVNPNKTEFCVGEAHTLTAAATVTGNATITYQWKVDGTSNTNTQTGVTTAGTKTYRVVATAEGCSDSAQKQITIVPYDVISLTADTLKTCSDGAVINLNTYRATGFSAGTWSGTGVTGTNFNPNVGAGNYKVKYTTSGTCPKSDSLIVSVTNKLNLQFNIQPIVVCADTPVFNISGLTNFANLTGGDFWGFGIDVSADATGKLGVFDASKVTPGTGLIYYGVQGACGDTVSLNATVNALDVANLTVDTIKTCSDGAVINLSTYVGTGSSAGTWSGTGVTGSNFNPNIGAGNYKLKYTTNGSCKATDSLIVSVTDKINLTFAIPPIAVCANAPVVVISAIPNFANVSGGDFWGFGIDVASDPTGKLGRFDASKATPGTGLLYYGIAGACGDTTSLNVTINPLDTAAILPPPSFCNSDPVTRLQLNTTVSTAGGTWSGVSGSSYIAANGDFNPAGLSEGKYKVYYKTPGVCSYTDSAEVEISNFVSYQITTAVDAGQTYKSFCITDPITSITVNINGGVYWTKSGNGFATQNTTNNNFNPAGLTAGTDTIFYGKAGDCGDTTFLPIVILPMDIAVIATGGVAKDTSVCVDNAAFNLRISSNSTTGGVWSGTGITNGANGTFNPATAGVGVHKIFYSTNGGGNRCDVRDSMLITVIKRAIPTFNVSADAFCGSGVAKQYTVAEGGGTFTSDLWGAPGGNAYTLVNPTTIQFNPVTAGPGVDSIFYTIGGQCGAQDTLIIGVAADDVAEIDVTSAGPFCQTDAAAQLRLTNNSTTGGFWTNGAGVNVNTYINAAGQFNPQHPSISTTNLNRVIYHTTGICPKKDTVMVSVVSEIITNITQNDTLRLCVDGATVPLTLSNNTTPNGTWRATPTNIVSNTGVINPALGTPGTTYKIKYAVYGGTATCADSDSVFVRIIPRMDASIVSFANTVNKDTTVCQGSGAFTLRALNTGGVWSGTGVNATTGVFNPSGLNPGTYTVKHTIQGEGNLCPDEKEVRVVIRPQININLASTMNDVCQGSPAFNLTQSYSPNPATGLWFVMPGNPALTISNASLGTINPTVAGTYTVHYGIADLCGDTTSINFSVVEVVNPAIANDINSPVCISQQTIDYNPVNTTTAGVWTVNNGGVIDANTGVMDIETSGSGTYRIIHTITTTGNGVSCPTRDTTNLTVEDYLLANINAAGPFCENLPAQQLTVTGATGGTWGGAANSQGIFLPNVSMAGTHEVTYRLQNACDTTYRRQIQVSGVPDTRYEIVNDNPTNCEPLTVTFRDMSGSPVNSTRWVLSTGETVLANGDLEVTFMAGVYYAGMIQDYQNGCKDTLALSLGNGSIDVDAVPYADFEWTPIVPNAKNPNVQFQNLQRNGSAFEWTFRTATPNFSTIYEPFVNYNAPDGDTSEVCLTVINGSCRADTCKTLIIINNLTVFMPNAFTPNGDNLNDIFYPMGKFHDNPMGSDRYRFWVFNRWGQEIFYTETPYAGWDGKYLNEPALQDVYVWRIEVFNPVSNKTETHVGQVTLYR